MKEKAKAYEPIYKRELKFKDGKLILNKQTYVPISKSMSDEFVKQMKNGGMWEDIVTADGQDYIPESRYKLYETLANALKNS